MPPLAPVPAATPPCILKSYAGYPSPPPGPPGPRPPVPPCRVPGAAGSARGMVFYIKHANTPRNHTDTSGNLRARGKRGNLRQTSTTATRLAAPNTTRTTSPFPTKADAFLPTGSAPPPNDVNGAVDPHAPTPRHPWYPPLPPPPRVLPKLHAGRRMSRHAMSPARLTKNDGAGALAEAAQGSARSPRQPTARALSRLPRVTYYFSEGLGWQEGASPWPPWAASMTAPSPSISDDRAGPFAIRQPRRPLRYPTTAPVP